MFMAEPLAVGLQNNSLVMWVKQHDDEGDARLRVWIIMTGADARDVTYANYLGTVKDELGLVFHVFWDVERHPSSSIPSV